MWEYTICVQAQLEALRKALGGIKVDKAPCPAGSEERIDRGKKSCCMYSHYMLPCYDGVLLVLDSNIS